MFRLIVSSSNCKSSSYWDELCYKLSLFLQLILEKIIEYHFYSIYFSAGWRFCVLLIVRALKKLSACSSSISANSTVLVWEAFATTLFAEDCEFSATNVTCFFPVKSSACLMISCLEYPRDCKISLVDPSATALSSLH